MRITTNDVSLIGVRFFVELMILDGGLASGDNPWLDCRGAADWRAETKWNAALLDLAVIGSILDGASTS